MWFTTKVLLYVDQRFFQTGSQIFCAFCYSWVAILCEPTVSITLATIWQGDGTITILLRISNLLGDQNLIMSHKRTQLAQMDLTDPLPVVTFLTIWLAKEIFPLQMILDDCILYAVTNWLPSIWNKEKT